MSAERDRMTFGALLEVLLGEANMTRAALGRQLGGIGRSSVQKWIEGESGRKILPEPVRVSKICDLTRCSDDDRIRLFAAYARETGALPVAHLSPSKIKSAARSVEALRGEGVGPSTF